MRGNRRALVRAFFGVDVEEAPLAVAHRDDAEDARAVAEAMAQRDVGAVADRDAMRDASAPSAVGRDLAARRRPASTCAHSVATAA